MKDYEFRSLIETVRERTDIVQVIGRRVNLDRNGKGLCPFHEEKTPSFSVSPKRQFFHCFGCGVGGDVFKFLQLFEKKPFIEVLLDLAREAGISVTDLSSEEREGIEQDRLLGDILTETAQFYHRSLTPSVRHYLGKERQFTEETVVRFKIGYANGGLKEHLLQKCGFPQALCIEAGVLKHHEGQAVRDYFYHRVIFPNIRRGRVVHLSGRSHNGHEPKYLHLPGEIHYLYNEDALSGAEPIVAEGIPDCISAVQTGYDAVAILGASAFKLEYVSKFSRCETVYLCLDGDKAGFEGMLRIGDLLGDRAKVISLPQGFDLDGFLRKCGRESFEALIKSAPNTIIYELGLIPSNTPKTDLPRRLDPVLRKLARIEKAKAEAYLTYEVKARFDLKKQDIDAYRDLVNKLRRIDVATPSTETPGSMPSGDSQSGNTGPYRIQGGRICIKRMTQLGPVTNELCNFVARVTEELVVDNGVDTTRQFVLQGKLDSGASLPEVRVPAGRFSGMTWIPELWGLNAVVRAGIAARDQLREAIQLLSPNPRPQHVYAHTGWRRHGDNWIYLTAGGAVGCDGFEVELDPKLSRYRLPRLADNPAEAMKASLRLLDVAPITVTAPLWGANYRAPLASALPIDLMLWLEGFSGSLKSSLAALFLCHYGDFNRLILPGEWMSTANILEQRAFALKDALFVVDDYVPTAGDRRELEAKAARLIRSQGNLSGRGRLRADLTQRPSYPPRGFIISTGEQHPPAVSSLARLLLIEVRKETLNLALLTEAQKMADRLPHAMSGYISWLAPQMNELPKLLRETFAGTRQRATAADEHLRVPEALAHLWLGIHCGLTYAVEIGACSPSEADAYDGRCWEALVALGRAQGRQIEGERPSRRFLGALQTLLTQRRVLLLPKNELGSVTKPEIPLIGWFDNEFLYLIPDAVFQAIVRFCRDAGEEFPVRQYRLKMDLDQEGLSECEPGRHTTTAKIGRHSKRVLKLPRRAIESVLGEELQVPVTEVTTVTGFGE